MGLTADEIQNLLSKELIKNVGYPAPMQHGPIQRRDEHKPCVKLRCGSPTYYRFRGIAYCHPHILDESNKLLMELGVEK